MQPYQKNSLSQLRQIPLVNFVAMTSHKLMGDTFDKLATSISATDSSYALWMTSRIFVIVSRVKQLKNLTFVGDKSATLNAIKALFEQRDFREERMFGLLDKIRNNRKSACLQAINIPRMSFVPFNKHIPQTPSGFVDLLVSVNPKSPSTFYVGQTSRPLLSSNSGSGSDVTSTPHGLSCAVAAFICNFEFDTSSRDLESEFHREMFERRNSLRTLNMQALFEEKVNEKYQLVILHLRSVHLRYVEFLNTGIDGKHGSRIA